MSRAIFNRFLLAVHGQGEHLETPQPKRHFVPGAWRRDGGRPSLPHCTGAGCNQGRTPSACDCDMEMGCDLAPDADRVIQPPPPKPEPNYRARANAMALAIVVALYAAVAALIGITDPRFTP